MSIVRVQYRERQRLTSADLRAEQDYRLGLGGRHHLSHHDWGVVRGLCVQGEEDAYMLAPGIAIDGYGREILVDQAAPLPALNLQQCAYVLLHYCDQPEQVPPGRACADEAGPRVRQRYALLANTSARSLRAVPDIADARAAGTPAQLAPWPVVIARVGDGCPAQAGPNAVAPPRIDYAYTRYVRHRAGLVRSPTGRAVLQLGLTGRSDVYHFALETAHGDALERRVAIDRDNVIHVWRELAILGTRFEAQLLFATRTVVLSIPRPSGIRGPIVLTGTLDKGRTLSFAIQLGAGFASNAPLRGAIGLAKLVRAPGVPKVVPLLDVTKEPWPWDLGIVAQRRPAVRAVMSKRKAARKQAAAAAAPPARAVDDSGPIEIDMVGAGGKLMLQTPVGTAAAPGAPAVCLDVNRQRGEAGDVDTPVIEFRPATELKADPLVREIYAITTSKPTDPVPATALCISGGAQDDTDTSPRISLGGWDGVAGGGAQRFTATMQIDAGRRVSIRGPAANPTQLTVERALYMPPIGRKDPLLPDLLAIAFMSGLRKAGSVVPAPAKITITGAPTEIVRGTDLAYTATAAGLGGYEIKQCFELITGTEGTGDLAFRVTEKLPDRSGANVALTSPQFTHPASIVRLELYVLVRIGSRPRVLISESALIKVVDPLVP